VDLAQLQIEFDHGLDGVADGAAIADADGSFNYLPQGLPAGNVTVRAHVIAWDPIQQALVAGPWTSVEFVYEPPVFAAATFDSITLARDTGSSTTDGITTDATLQGKVTAHGFGNTPAYLQIEFDHDGNATVDGATQTDASGNFRYVPVGLSLGARSLRARIKEWNYLTRQGNVGAWSDPINFTLEAPQNLAADVAMNLLVITDNSGPVPVTTNSMLVGQVTNDQPGRIAVEFDHGNGGAAEGLAFTDESGFFHYQPQGLPLGAVTISARAVEWNHLTSQYQFGAPTTINFTYTSQPIAAAQITALDLESPLAGSPTTTNSPVFVGRLVDSSFNQVLVVEVDTTGDGTPDQFTTADQLGNFRVQLNVAPGTHTISARPRKIHPATGQLLHGPSVSRSFTYEQAIDAVPILTGLGLKNDTGASNSDGQTTDHTLKGQATNDGAVAGLQVQFDYNDNDADGINGTATTTADGQFSFLPAGLDLGQHTIRARIKEYTSSQTVQYSAWQSVQFTLLDARFGQARVDSLALANDDGNSTSDGATSDATITGHVSDATAGTVVEFDINGDGTFDGTATTDGNGDFEFEATELVAGLVTMRARVQPAAGETPVEWKSTSFVLDENPDGTQAQSLVAAFSSFSTLWQDARSDWQFALQTADDLLRSQTAISQSTYDTSIASAAALRQSTIDTARNTYNGILAGAENARGQALANAGSQLASDLANFNGDTTSFAMQPFQWPDAPPEFGESPGDEERPTPPVTGPTFTGANYDFSADAQYQAALAALNYQYAQKLQQAQQIYDEAVGDAEDKYKDDLAAAGNRYNQDTDAAVAAQQQALNSGTNPINIQAITAQIRQQQKALFEQLQRDNERAMREDAERHAAHWGQLLQERAEIEDHYRQLEQDIIDRHNNGTINDQQYWNELADLEVPWVTATANKDLELFLWDTERVRAYDEGYANRHAAYDLAVAPLEQQLAEQGAKYIHWEKAREINAQRLFNGLMAEAKRNLEVDSAEARRVQTRSLADAASKLEIAQEKAKVTLWNDQALAKQSAYNAYAGSVQTPWTTYQKALLDHAVTYATNMATKFLSRIDADGQKALEQVQTVADKRKTLDEHTADDVKTREVDDFESWKGYLLTKNDKALEQQLKQSQDWLKHYQTTRPEMKKFELYAYAAFEKWGKAEHRRVRDQSVEGAEATADWLRSGQTDQETYEQAGMQIGRDSAVAFAKIWHSYESDMFVARDGRDKALSQAEKDLTVWNNTSQQTYEDGLITADETNLKDRADHIETQQSSGANWLTQFLKEVATAEAGANKFFAQSDKELLEEDATRQSTWHQEDATSLAAFYNAATGDYVQQVSSWDSAVNSPWSHLIKGLAEVAQAEVQTLAQKTTTHASQGDPKQVTLLKDIAAHSKTMADQTADALKKQSDSVADALAEFNRQAAQAKKSYSRTIAEKTGNHDRDVNARHKALQDKLAERQRVLTNELNAADLALERRMSQLLRDRTIALADATLLPEEEQADAVAQANAAYDNGSILAAEVQRDTVAEKQRAYALGVAADNQALVAAVGPLHVTLAEDVKTADDNLATSLKSAGDIVADKQSDAGKQLGEDLAAAEDTYASDNAESQKTYESEMDTLDADLSSGIVTAVNASREGITRENAEYQVERSQNLASGMQSALASVPEGPTHELADYQLAIAQADLTWEQGVMASEISYQQLLSTAYAQFEESEGDSADGQLDDSADTDATREAGLADADSGLTSDSTENLGTFGVDFLEARSKANSDELKAETAYDLERAKAKRDYNDDIAQAEYTRTDKISLAEMNYAKGVPVGVEYTPEWYQTPEAQALKAARDSAIAAAQADYEADVRAAEFEFAGKIGNAQVDRAEQWGNAVVTQANEEGDAGETYVTSQNADLATYEQRVTTVQLAAVQGEAAAIRDRAIAAKLHLKDLTSALGSAGIALVQQLAPINVQRVATIAAAEGAYQLAQASRAASQALAAASGAASNSQAAFDAAYAGAQAAWVSSMRPGFTAYASAMTQADNDEMIALAQAAKAINDAHAVADEQYTVAVEALVYDHTMATRAIQRAWVEQDTATAGAQRLATAQANKILNAAHAAATKARSVSLAESDMAYATGVLDPGSSQSEAELAKARDLAYADASIVYVGSAGDADVTWTTSAIHGERVFRDDSATDWKEANTQLAEKDRDLALGIATHDQTRSNAYGTAQQDLWTAEVNAENARRTAEANARANLRSADYAATASALSALDSTMDLPWTSYQSTLAATKQNWWETQEKANFLALFADMNAADSAYQVTVNGEYATSVSQTATADLTFAQTEAAARFLWQSGDYLADETYLHSLSGSEETWQINTISAGRSYNSSLATNYRAWVNTGDLPAREAADAAALAAYDTANIGYVQSHTATEATAAGIQSTTRAGNRRTYIESFGPAATARVETSATADKSFEHTKASANATRVAAIASAISDHDVIASQTLADAIEALAAANGSPWAHYDAAVANAEEAYAVLVMPALRDLAIAEANAERDFQQEQASAEWQLTTSIGQYAATAYLSVATADRDNAIDAAIADNAAAQSLPLGALAAARASFGNNGQTSFESLMEGLHTPRAWPLPFEGPERDGERPGQMPAPAAPRADTEPIPVADPNDTQPTRLPVEGGDNGRAMFQLDVTEGIEIKFNPSAIPAQRVNNLLKAGLAVPTHFGPAQGGKDFVVVVDQLGPNVVLRVLERYWVKQADSKRSLAGRAPREYYKLVAEKWFDTGAPGAAVTPQELFAKLRTEASANREAGLVYDTLKTNAVMEGYMATEFAFRLIPFGSAALDFGDGKYVDGGLALAGDIAFFTGIGAAGKVGTLANAARRTAQGIELGIIGIQGTRATLDIMHGRTDDAVAHAGEATLMLLGFSVTQIQQMRAAARAKAGLASAAEGLSNVKRPPPGGCFVAGTLVEVVAEQILVTPLTEEQRAAWNWEYFVLATGALLAATVMCIHSPAKKRHPTSENAFDLALAEILSVEQDLLEFLISDRESCSLRLARCRSPMI
jgi:hypothetical protein